MPNYYPTYYTGTAAVYTTDTTAVNTNYYYTTATNVVTTDATDYIGSNSAGYYYYSSRINRNNVKCVGARCFCDHELKCDILVPDFTYRVSYEIRFAIGKFVKERFFMFAGTPKYEAILINIANAFMRRLIKDNEAVYRHDEFVLAKK
jgi:Txe/YoeB family toxin of Txe-Axe toxin-antitoxin module